MQASTNDLLHKARQSLDKISEINNFNSLWLQFFGSSGFLNQELKKIKLAPADKKPGLGKNLNFLDERFPFFRAKTGFNYLRRRQRAIGG